MMNKITETTMWMIVVLGLVLSFIAAPQANAQEGDCEVQARFEIAAGHALLVDVHNIQILTDQYSSSTELFGTNLTLFPNPVIETFDLVIDGNEEIMAVNLYSLSGKEFSIAETGSGDNRRSYSMRSVPPGLYILEVMFSSGESVSLKLLKQ